MKYFDKKKTKDKIKKIQKVDCIFTDDVVSLDDEKVQKICCYTILHFF